MIKRRELRKTWMEDVLAEIELAQREPQNNAEDCLTTYTQKMKPMLSLEDQGWLNRQLFELGYGRKEEGLNIFYIPHGSMRNTLCRQPY